MEYFDNKAFISIYNSTSKSQRNNIYNLFTNLRIVAYFMMLVSHVGQCVIHKYYTL